MRSIAIITARGGSKRIPKKNIRDFCGKPIMSYSIEAALGSNSFDEVMVSTDSNEIAAIARDYGAKVPFLRSKETSDDFATTSDVINEVINEYEKRGVEFDCICCIYPTAPFITSDKLSVAMKYLDDETVEGIVPVVKFGFPPQRAFVIEDEMLKYKYPDCALARSQDLEPYYHDCGQFYICRTEAFKREGTMITKRIKPLIVSEEEVQDIDTFSDWNLAEIKFKKMMSEK